MATSLIQVRRFPEAPPSTLRPVLLALIATLLPLAILALLLPPVVVLAISVPALFLLPWFRHDPIRGVYVLVAAALLFEMFAMNFSDSITDRIPFFANLNHSDYFGSLSVTPAEIVLVAALLAAIAYASAVGRRWWPSGRLVGPYVVYALVLLMAEVNGLLARGNWYNSLWELRPQAYGFLMFLLAGSLVTSRLHLQRLAAIFFVAVGIKAILGSFRYLVTLGSSLLEGQGMLAHEESYFLGLFLVAVVAALIWYRKRRVLVPLFALSPVVLFALLENQRRVGVFAAELGVAIVVVLAARFDFRLRGKILAGAFAGLIAVTAFATTYWNQQSGAAAQVLRPVKSQFYPDQRDYQSNLYRFNEDANILLAFRSSPVIGMGFGRRFDIVFPLADISQIYPFWNLIPHNTLLWIGLRMGIIGFVAFWCLIGMAILQAMHQVATRRDGLLRAVAVFAVAAIVAEILVGYADIQLENYRNMIFFGALLGVLNRMPEIPDG